MTEGEWLSPTNPLAMTDWLFFDFSASDRKLRLFSVACCRPVVVHTRQFAPYATRLLALTEAFADRQIPPRVLSHQCEELIGQWRAYDDEVFLRYRANRSEGSVNGINEVADATFWFVSQCGVNAVAYSGWWAEERDRPASQYRLREFYQGPDRRSFPFATAAEGAEAVVMAVEQDSEPARERARGEMKQYQLGLLHDIFGNPFRPASINPILLTPTIISLAVAAYEQRSLPSGELDAARLAVLSDALEEAGCDNTDILKHLRGSGPHVRGCWVVDLILGKM